MLSCDNDDKVQWSLIFLGFFATLSASLLYIVTKDYWNYKCPNKFISITNLVFLITTTPSTVKKTNIASLLHTICFCYFVFMFGHWQYILLWKSFLWSMKGVMGKIYNFFWGDITDSSWVSISLSSKSICNITSGKHWK